MLRNPSSITMPCLRTLKVDRLRAQTFVYLFRLIAAPVLGTLGIHRLQLRSYDPFHENNPHPLLRTTLSAFFSTSSQSLRLLSVTDPSACFTPDTMPALLRLVPHITSLELGGVNYTELIEMILNNLCPELESLYMSTGLSREIQQLIQARLEKDNNLQPIRRLRIKDDAPQMGFIDWLKYVPNFAIIA